MVFPDWLVIFRAQAADRQEEGLIGGKRSPTGPVLDSCVATGRDGLQEAITSRRVFKNLLRKERDIIVIHVRLPLS